MFDASCSGLISGSGLVSSGVGSTAAFSVVLAEKDGRIPAKKPLPAALTFLSSEGITMLLEGAGFPSSGITAAV